MWAYSGEGSRLRLGCIMWLLNDALAGVYLFLVLVEHVPHFFGMLDVWRQLCLLFVTESSSCIAPAATAAPSDNRASRTDCDSATSTCCFIPTCWRKHPHQLAAGSNKASQYDPAYQPSQCNSATDQSSQHRSSTKTYTQRLYIREGNWRRELLHRVPGQGYP